jgi:hypothetical protein
LSCGRSGVHSNSAGFAGFRSASAGDGHRGRKIHFIDFIRICGKGVAVVEGENVGVARAARADDIIERENKRAALAGGPESSVAASGRGARQFGESSGMGGVKKNSRTVAGNGVLRRASVSSEERSRKWVCVCLATSNKEFNVLREKDVFIKRNDGAGRRVGKSGILRVSIIIKSQFNEKFGVMDGGHNRINRIIWSGTGKGVERHDLDGGSRFVVASGAEGTRAVTLIRRVIV